jgi:hypothetical protein
MSSQGWSDDELLRELGAALREAQAAEAVVQAAQAAFAWRTVDTDLELLALTADSWLAADEPVRRGGPEQPRTLDFRGERLAVEIEIDEAEIVGQLTPPGPGQITLVAAGGQEVATQADEVGCFAYPLPSSGPVRLRCDLGRDTFVTEWIAL